jgi:K+-transporting ATPase ATPase C chain
VKERLAAAANETGVSVAQVPVDLVTASASGLDPDVSLQSALIQVNRVARARGLRPQRVEQLVRSHVQGKTLGFLGRTRVNVLELNVALTKLRPQ